MSIKKPIKTFLEGSSMKGVPKIVKSPRTYQKSLWVLALLLGLGVGGYQLVNLSVMFFSFSTSITSSSTSQVHKYI